MSRLGDKLRLLIVTGKGGVGKSVLAAAVARRSAERGLKTVLVTFDSRSDRHPLLGVPVDYQPAMTAHGFAVSRVDAFQAAAEYARRRVPFGGFYESFFASRTFKDFAAASPGFEELMCLGKLYNLAMETDYDRVVFDAPASGHLRDLLAVPAATQRAVRVGPLNHNARKIEDLLLDPERTRLLIATLAEDMPVREALETLKLCRNDLRLGCGPVLVNRRVRQRFSSAELDAADRLADQGALADAGRSALASARDEMTEWRSQEESLQPLRDAGLDLVEVPRIVQARFDGDALIAAVSEGLSSLVGDSRGEPGVPPAPVSSAATGHPPVDGQPPLDFVELVRGSRIVVCCGSGGVGKTTSAAALGVLAARQGLKVQVMTIDPARRLAQAMGLDTLDHDAQQIVLDAPGQLSAMMLDSKRAFDRLVESYAPSPAVRDAIFANHYYQQLSTSLGGSRELVAMERVLEVASAGQHDLLIVDTPPSQHALDFLDAPQRLISLLDGSLTRILVRPYGFAARAQFNLFRQSSAAALKFMERFTGVEMLADLSEFLLAFSGMFDGFKERSHRVQALLRDPATAFVLVCAPEPASLHQVDQFAGRLSRDGMRIAGVLANRVQPEPAGWQSGVQGRSADELDFEAGELAALAQIGDRQVSDLPLPERLAQCWQDAAQAYQADQLALAAVRGGTLALHCVPRLSHDLHSMEDVEAFAGLLRAPAKDDS